MSFFRETILEHVAHELGKDPLTVRKLNWCGPNDVCYELSKSLPNYVL